ncbi:MAG: cadherin-like domain-containing protein [Fibrobacter sp.]|nr:cadherin-like domain-containing protein [Fibrobacter sp.]
MGLKTNNGWGEVIAGKAATDSDKDGMPDYFEDAMGYDSAKDDAMVKESDGYVRIEKYINWLGAMHAKVEGNGTLDFDLRSITRGFQEVKPAYSVLAAENGTVDLQKDGYTARFTPDKNFKGLASFKYTVKGNDNTEYTGRVEVLVEKAAGSGEQPRDTVSRDSSVSVADSTEKDSIPTRLTENFRLHGNLESMKVFDMNGNYMGSSTQNLPQGRYIVLQKIQGRTVNVVYIKH